MPNKAEAQRGERLSQATEPALPAVCLAAFLRGLSFVPSHSHSHTPPSPHPRAMWLRQLLPGSGGTLGRGPEGRAERQQEESPTGLLPVWAPRLPELLSLTESHDHVGDGDREARGLGQGGADSSRSLHSPVALLRQAAGDPRPKGRSDRTEKGPGHREALSWLRTHSPWGPGNAPAPWASVYPSVAQRGGVCNRTNSAPRKETGKLPQINVKFFFRILSPMRP